MKQHIVDTAHVKIEIYRKGGGKGANVLFLHGTGGNAVTNWTTILHNLDLKTDWQCICPNLPGSGQTPVKENLSIQGLSELIIALLDELKIEKTHIVGFSLGAALALYMAGNYTKRFLSVVSIGGFIDSKSPRTQLILDLWQQALEVDIHIASRILLLALFSPQFLLQFDQKSLTRLLSTFEKSINWQGMKVQIQLDKNIDIQSALPGIKQPVLLITGKMDEIIPYESATQLYHHIPQSNLIRLSTGHYTIAEEPEEISDLLVSFIKNR